MFALTAGVLIGAAAGRHEPTPFIYGVIGPADSG